MEWIQLAQVTVNGQMDIRVTKMTQHAFPFRDLLFFNTLRLSLEWRQHVLHKRLLPPTRMKDGTAQKL